jgi:membrane protein implicated in regulation of membrane protease activity
MLDWISDETKISMGALGAAATLLDLELLEKFPKGVLASAVLMLSTALVWFVKRDLKRYTRSEEEETKRWAAVEKRLTVVETKAGVHDAAKEGETEGEKP